MKTINVLKTVAIVMLLSSPVLANTDGHNNEQTKMPMMSEGSHGSMKEHSKHHGDSMMGGEDHGMGMKTHMSKMENSLANIEALLSQLVELQKKQ